MKRWLKHLVEAYRRGPVLTLGLIGLFAVSGALFVNSWGQSVLINVGTALLLIPPIVVTERLVLAEDVQESTRQALQEVAALREDLAQEHADLMELFREDADFRAIEALELFKESSMQYYISKWGIAVTLVDGRYDLLLGFHFNDSSYAGSTPHFLPAYAISAQSEINARVLADEDPDFILEEMVWRAEAGETTASLLRGVRDDLLDRGLHPPQELDFPSICRRFKKTLTLKAEARTPGAAYRTNLEAVICLVGDELVITRNGIEHLTDNNSEAIPLWATFGKAGLLTKKVENGESSFPDEHWFEKSSLQDHPDLETALTAIRVLYRSGFLRGLEDHQLVG